MNNYQFYAERKKLPPVFTRIITGKSVVTIARAVNGKVAMGSQEVPEQFWNMGKSA